MTRLRSTQTLISITFALALAEAVIWLAGYYEGPVLWLFQTLWLGGLTFAPFLFLPRRGRLAVWGWFLTAIIVTAGWSLVVYADTRPYEGGGASLAGVFGFFACFVAGVIAAIISVIDRRTRFGGRR